VDFIICLLPWKGRRRADDPTPTTQARSFYSAAKPASIFCRDLPVELQSLVYVKIVKIGNVISTEGRNPTEPMEPEFQAFREDEISPFVALRSKW